jgi:hypothetical protein
VCPSDVVAEAEGLVGRARFIEGPRMCINAEDTEIRRLVGTECTEVRRDCSAGDAGAASEIHDRARSERRIDGRDDVADEEEVQRAVVERERGALAGPVEGLVIGQRRALRDRSGNRQLKTDHSTVNCQR